MIAQLEAFKEKYGDLPVMGGKLSERDSLLNPFVIKHLELMTFMNIDTCMIAFSNFEVI